MKKLVALCTALILSFSLDSGQLHCQAICSAPFVSSGTGTLPATCDGTAATQTVNSGDVLEFMLVADNEYVFSICGSSTAVFNDSQLDLWDATFTTAVASNDDGCTMGSQFFSEIVYTPSADETVNLAIYRWFCSTIGGEAWTLSVSCTESIGNASLCPTGYEEAQIEDFSSCALPAGWTLTNSGPAGGTSTGACTGTDVFSFDCTNGFAGSSGGGPSPGFADCQAVVTGANMLDNTATGEACLYSPVLDASTYQALQLSFDWQLEDYAGDGAMTVDVYTGAAWQTVFSFGVDGNGQEALNVSSFINSTFQVRYCFDTESEIDPSQIWGMAIDNHVICGEPAPIVPTMSTWALICLALSMLSLGLIMLNASVYTRRLTTV